MTMAFSYSPPPDSSPPPPTPSQGVDFESFFGRFRVDFESRLENDSKSTRKRPKMTRNRLPERGVGGGGG